MRTTRRPKTDKSLEPIAAKIPGELKRVLVNIAHHEERSLSFVVEKMLAAHPKVRKNLALSAKTTGA